MSAATVEKRWGAGLGRLMGEFSEETLHLLLEALAAVVAADGAAGARWEPRLSPAVLQIWAAHVKDPLLSMDALLVLQGLASIPAALPSLQVAKSPSLPLFLRLAPPSPGSTSECGVQYASVGSSRMFVFASDAPSTIFTQG